MVGMRFRRRVQTVVWSLALLGAWTLLLPSCKSEEEKRAEAMAKAAEKLAESMKEVAAAGASAAGEAAKGMEQAQASAKAAADNAQGGMEAAAAGMEHAAQAMNKMAEAMAKGGQAGTRALVDFRELKKLLPEKVGAFERKSATGEKAGAMGMGVSKARGEYQTAAGEKLRIEILDTAGMAAMMAFGLGAVEIDKETEDGYERTVTLDGYKGLEKYNGKSKRGELKLLVGNRFIVEIDGRGVSMDAVSEARKSLDLGALAALAPQGN